MKINAAKRLLAKLDGRDTEKLTLEIEATPEAMKTIVNLLAAISYNTGVGHSCVIGAYFDGDGADKVSVEGLPRNNGAEMAEACSNFGDGYMACIQSDSAFAHNVAGYNEKQYPVVKKELVFKKGKRMF